MVMNRRESSAAPAKPDSDRLPSLKSCWSLFGSDKSNVLRLDVYQCVSTPQPTPTLNSEEPSDMSEQEEERPFGPRYEIYQCYDDRNRERVIIALG